jgi:hypothetical protein
VKVSKFYKDDQKPAVRPATEQFAGFNINGKHQCSAPIISISAQAASECKSFKFSKQAAGFESRDCEIIRRGRIPLRLDILASLVNFLVDMQPSTSMLGTGPVQGVSSVTACLSSSPQVGLQEQMHSQQHQINNQQQHFSSQFDQTNQPHQNMDDFLEQMLFMPQWSDVAGGKSPWEFNPNNAPQGNNASNNNNSPQNLQSNTQKLFTMSLMPPGIGSQGLNSQENDGHAGEHMQYSYDQSPFLANRLRQHQLSGNSSINQTPNQVSQGINETNTSPGRSMVLQLSTGNASASQLLASMGNSPRGTAVMTRSPSTGGSCNGSDGGMLPLPLSLGQAGKSGDMNEPGSREEIEASFKSVNNARDSNLGGLFQPFAVSPRGVRPTGQNFHAQPGQVPMQGYGGMPQPQHQNPPPTGVGAAPPVRPRVRARRGQATDPHSIAERLRRERIAERMKALQELVPNSNKTDKASMLDEIIDYVKFLQLQVKVLSMSRLGGAGAVAPLVADIPAEGANAPQGTRTNGSQNSSPDGLALTERQVAKLMEEDMGTAMQYLQGKGLCLMPISLASAINNSGSRPQAPSTPSLQGLLASNVNDRQVLEPSSNSALSALTSTSMTIQPSISSPGSGITEQGDNAHKAGNGTRNPKDSREANSVTKSNGIGPALSKNAVKGEDEPQRRTGQ